MDLTVPRLDLISNVHSITEQILQRIVLLQGYLLRYADMTLAEQAATDPKAVKREYLDPLFGLAGAFFELDQAEGSRILDPFFAAAHSLGLDSSRRRFRNIEWSSVHGLVVQVCGYFLRLWDRAFDPQSQILVPLTTRLQRFIAEAHTCLAEFNPTPYKTDLDREFLVSCGRVEQRGDEMSIVRTAEIWELRYQGESARYPQRGNQSIVWLAKLLTTPNRSLSTADLCGDPEGKLTADARIGGESETDEFGMDSIRKRLEEIDDIAGVTGGSESLENEKANLLRRLKDAKGGKQLRSALKAAHHNVASQIRGLIKKKLTLSMPKLAAHMKAALKFDFPHVGYYPPTGTPDWKI